MTYELTVTSKGQLTIRRDVLKHLGIRPGERVAVELLPEGRVMLRSAKHRPRLAEVKGCLQRPGQEPVSLEAMQEAIEGGPSQ